ncbi:hypothetical protein [Zoogloea sp.]|uniref:hypothetical protein n=1 Tax=Zoogloea sp. TaxID=49181 RepID=UPI001AC7CC6C|nr:hypothetical protein [Zoogloea sp.]MBN8281950.1 hypothetical protein [Zoogloea sp.]
MTDKWGEASLEKSLTDFKVKVASSSFARSASGFFGFGPVGECPTYNLSVDTPLLKFDVDSSVVFCGPTAQFIYTAVAAVTILSALYGAWWIIFIL